MPPSRAGRWGASLGEPEAYAAELRSAAGLPPRVDVVAAPDAVRREPWTDRLARDAHGLVERHPWLRELRPTWWLARGAVAGWVVAAVLGTGRSAPASERKHGVCVTSFIGSCFGSTMLSRTRLVAGTSPVGIR